MKILDRLYLNFYWCWNTEKGGELKDTSLEKVIMIILWSITFIILSVLLSLLKVNLLFSWQLIISAIISFFLSGKLFKKYYTTDRKLNIINNNDKPGNVKYLVFILVLFGAAGLLFTSYFLGRYILK
jgi:hypothetical protein